MAKDISIATENRNLSTLKGTDIYNTLLYTEPNTSDTLRFKLTEQDWIILKESFEKNQLYLIDNTTKIGERVHSIYMPHNIKIKTNKRLLSVQYRFFIGEKENFDHIKSEKFKKFLKTFDSLVYYRSKKHSN
ncbi:hypothetical protein CQ022_15710 [Chryseobacterium culicis]|uniref:Uncharacterized protein n=1 Tax=Chryseobacterium culicis TaxID=680127 RepID=A0A2S9CST7_CHRCI|nr:hypothetical protein CQ022_15710 [Chryseobacterium culicis]PRB89794.1 hypothetical protein CQ033_14605 [Chryseobacterium culicis]